MSPPRRPAIDQNAGSCQAPGARQVQGPALGARTPSPSAVSGRTASSRWAISTAKAGPSPTSTTPSPIKTTKWRCSSTTAPCSTPWTPARRPRSPSTTAVSTRRTSSGRCCCPCTATTSTTTRRIQRDAPRPGHRHQQQHGAGAVFDRQHRQANIDEARTYFARVGTDLVTHLAKLSSMAAELSTPDGCGCCGISSRPVSRLPSISTCASTRSAATASRTGSAPTAWSSPPTTSKIDARFGRCCICRIMPAISRTASSRNSATLTAA